MARIEVRHPGTLWKWLSTWHGERWVDKDSVVKAITATDLQTIVGPVTWKGGPVANVAKTQLSGGQWRRSGGGWDLEIVSNKAAPDIDTTSEMQLIET